MALKRATFKQFQMNKSDENKEKFREANRASRKAVRIAGCSVRRSICKVGFPRRDKDGVQACQNQREEIKGYFRYAFHK